MSYISHLPIGILLAWFLLFGIAFGWVLGYQAAKSENRDPLADEFDNGGGI